MTQCNFRDAHVSLMTDIKSEYSKLSLCIETEKNTGFNYLFVIFLYTFIVFFRASVIMSAQSGKRGSKWCAIFILYLPK